MKLVAVATSAAALSILAAFAVSALVRGIPSHRPVDDDHSATLALTAASNNGFTADWMPPH